MSTVMPTQRRPYSEFIFRGNATAGSGFLTSKMGLPITLNPEKRTVHGESSLPMAGGVSHSVVREPDLSFPEFIRYSECETLVVGGPEGENMVTTLRASVKNVRVGTSPSPEDDVPNVESIAFEAASLSIEARSIHPQSGEQHFELGEPPTAGLYLAITRSSGEVVHTPIRLIFDESVMALRTLDQLDREFLGNRDFFDQHRSCFDTAETLTFGNSKVPRTRDGYVLLPIVKQVVLGEKTIEGNVLHVQGYGRISFGVMVTDRISRRISLVRIKFGSDPGGNSCLTSVETNGIWQ